MIDLLSTSIRQSSNSSGGNSSPACTDGGRNTAVYRFWINCCAADAQPLAIALDSDQTEAFANDQWVQVEGTFELRKINGKLIPIVLKPRIKPSKAPSIPYLF